VTRITFQDGKIVLRDGQVGTEEACCCGGGVCCFAENCNLEWKYGDNPFEDAGGGFLFGLASTGFPCSDFADPPDYDCCIAYSIGDPCPDPDDGFWGVRTFAKFVCDECCADGSAVNCRIVEQTTQVVNPCQGFTPESLELRFACTPATEPCNPLP